MIENKPQQATGELILRLMMREVFVCWYLRDIQGWILNDDFCENITPQLTDVILDALGVPEGKLPPIDVDTGTYKEWDDNIHFCRDHYYHAFPSWSGDWNKAKVKELCQEYVEAVKAGPEHFFEWSLRSYK